MVDEIKEALKARCRGLILQILMAQKKLAGNRPTATVDVVVIRSLLGRFGIAKTEDELESELRYLENRMYVKIHRVESMGINITTVELDDYAKSLFTGQMSDDTVLIDA